MTLNGKRDDFVLADFEAGARAASLKRGRAKTILADVCETVGRWRNYADDVGVSPTQRDAIQNALRLGPFA